MERSQLITLIADKAMGYLEYDDAHPDVGMGMWIGTAVDLAEQAVLKEAARWNSIEALRLDFSAVHDDVVRIVRERRNR